MTSIWLQSSTDQENRVCATNNKNIKQSAKTSSNGGGLSVRALNAPPKRNTENGRGFGDISNVLNKRNPASSQPYPKQYLQTSDIVYTPKKSATKKSQLSSNRNVSARFKRQNKEKNVDVDFFPDILEKDDYSDLLPPELLLPAEHMNLFAGSWNNLQRPDECLDDRDSLSGSPSRLQLDFEIPTRSHCCGLPPADELVVLPAMPVLW